MALKKICLMATLYFCIAVYGKPLDARLSEGNLGNFKKASLIANLAIQKDTVDGLPGAVDISTRFREPVFVYNSLREPVMYHYEYEEMVGEEDLFKSDELRTTIEEIMPKAKSDHFGLETDGKEFIADIDMLDSAALDGQPAEPESRKSTFMEPIFDHPFDQGKEKLD